VRRFEGEATLSEEGSQRSRHQLCHDQQVGWLVAAVQELQNVGMTDFPAPTSENRTS
jgi:hypothetical protein